MKLLFRPKVVPKLSWKGKFCEINLFGEIRRMLTKNFKLIIHLFEMTLSNIQEYLLTDATSRCIHQK